MHNRQCARDHFVIFICELAYGIPDTRTADNLRTCFRTKYERIWWVYLFVEPLRQVVTLIKIVT